ncbi:Phytochelatin synthase-domain-containing protein [Halteromyces radiatus]|uniref:Phytochelatin synthase-domain-containing protein n=1 Tax=Halteromyces radiatus TaxID=101107 RepID=UPI00221F87FD|nr:Phytochelatin synthase-domain-containing protein [Halteromyces radiatus]KAI8096821.1 Phytochelatin synthase-domain-containing protein [Halteromyces radiatus]
MCMKAFTSSLRLHSRKKVNKELPLKTTPLCANCSRSISTTTAKSTNLDKVNKRPDSIPPLSQQLDQQSKHSFNSSSEPSSVNVSSSSTHIPSPPPANPTAAFQDLLGLNNDSNRDLENTFYQRELPATLVRFSSDKGKSLFRESMELGFAEAFFPLTGNFTTQSEPAYCGPSSLAMVLNALEVDPKRKWKGNWRWYSDELLDCCLSKEEMKINGITFDKFACLAKCHSEVIAKRAPTFSFDEFQKDVIDVTARSDKFLVVSFSRKTLGQTGDGHFSPIGAYNPDSKMVLVLDTARYKYPSYWCPIDTLYESMNPVDKETGRPRGYFLISYDIEHPPVRLCNPTQQNNKTTSTGLQSSSSSIVPTLLNWSTIAQTFCKRIPENMWLEKPRSLEHAIQVVLRNVPPEFTRILASQSMASSKAYSEQQHQPDQAKNYIRLLLQDTTKSPLYPIVFKTLYPSQPSPPLIDNNGDQQVDQHAAFATLFILGSPRMLYSSLPRDLQDTLIGYRQEEYMTDVVKREVDRISQEVKELTKAFCTCGPGWTKEENPPSCC